MLNIQVMTSPGTSSFTSIDRGRETWVFKFLSADGVLFTGHESSIPDGTYVVRIDRKSNRRV